MRFQSDRLGRLLGACCILLTVVTAGSAVRSQTATALSFEDRVKAQEAIERVYYAHRIWPKENPQPKPPFEQMVPRSVIEAKVTDYLKKSAALGQYWQRPIQPSQLQAEMDRMAKGTKDPAMLKELFAALGNDPYMIAECLARPVLADHLAREGYEGVGPGAKGSQVDLPERRNNEADPTPGSSFDAWWSLKSRSLSPDDPTCAGPFSLPTLPEMGTLEAAACSGVWVHSSMNEVLEAHAQHSAVWTGTEMIIWGGNNDADNTVLQSGYRYDPSTDSWSRTSESVNCPSPRNRHTAVWTGSEMVVWGGSDSSGYSLGTGSRYHPSSDTWQAVSGTSAPSARQRHTAVWTGSVMIVWGGHSDAAYTSTGGRYNPATNLWQATSNTSPPSARAYHTAVWTGSEMIVWGGGQVGFWVNTGGRYSPGTNLWTVTPVESNTPGGRFSHAAVWTGTEMVIWGGSDGWNYFQTGGRYNPAGGTWSATSTASPCPSARATHTAIWDGGRMVVWGGRKYSSGTWSFYGTGGLYDPANDTWAATSTGAGCPAGRIYHTAVWTGTEMIVWGGGQLEAGADVFLRSGGRYTPSGDTWVETNPGGNAPQARHDHILVWTGAEVIVWGGYAAGSGGRLNDGSRYDPALDAWTPTSTAGAPSKRYLHTAVWTGTEMIVWGGSESSSTNTGGRYDPVGDGWTSTSVGSDCPDARFNHRAVWTGTEMIVWGGYGSGCLNTGGRYSPAGDTWQPTSTTGDCPTARTYHTMVWCGSVLVVWGGYNEGTYIDTGGRYYPASDTWAATSVGPNKPAARYQH
jgi:N-acetylneuraminic acid mutarotase